MTKQVHTRDMVAHLWAHKAQNSARTAGGGSFFFTGPTLYSYGSHFVCAHHMPEAYRVPCDVRGSRPVALFNAGHYSMTTSRHMTAARHALPRFIARVDVPGLNENMVRSIGNRGAGDVVAALIGELRSIADKAANPRIRPATRGGLFSQARDIRADALHLATVDAGRRDLSAPLRKAARAQLATLAAVPPQDGEDKAGAVAYAFALNRAQYVERMTEYVGRAERVIGSAVYNVECGNFATAERYIVDAENAASIARDFAKKARRELPRAFARELRQYAAGTAWRAMVAEKARTETVDAARVTWAEGEAIARDAMAAREFYIVERMLAGDVRRAFETLHGEPGDAERRAFVAEATAAAQAWRAKSETEQAREALAAAREAYAAGKFARAHDVALSAAHKFRRNSSGASPEDVQALAAAEALAVDAEARKPEEFAAMLADWRNAAPGARFPDALHGNGRDRAAFLRLSADRRRVETSQGAEVPARVCAALWPMIGECKRTGAARTFPGGSDPGAVRLGRFLLDAIDGDGNIRAGCHFIPFSELADIAGRLNFAPHN